MARIKNDPADYVTRSKQLPLFASGVVLCPQRLADRFRSFSEAPISASFYIDHRLPARERDENSRCSPPKNGK